MGVTIFYEAYLNFKGYKRIILMKTKGFKYGCSIFFWGGGGGGKSLQHINIKFY